MKRVIKSNIFQQYDEYLSSHIHNVQRAWHELLRPYLAEHGIDDDDLQDIDSRIDAHDASFARDFRFIGNNMYSIIECVETIETDVNDLKDAIRVWKNNGFRVD